jgi:carboxymethylenebutenolidase
MDEHEIRIQTGEGEMSTFVAHPDGEGPFTVAILFMDGVGYREQIKENARRFASDGYYVAAPDLFYRSGEKLSFDFAQMRDETYRERLRHVMAEVTLDAAMRDTRALLDDVAGDPSASDGPLVCVGYCMGARLALYAAASIPDEIVTAAGIHPSALVTDQPDSHRVLATVRGELYFAFAEHDQSATLENVDRFRTELERQNVRGVVERLPGTNHGFAMADLPVYDREATERHFERTLDLWRRNLPR